MKRLILMVTTIFFIACQTEDTKEVIPMNYNEYPVYERGNLGVTYTPQKTTFKLWAPTATDVILKLYDEGMGGNANLQIAMKQTEKGTWEAGVPRDLEGQFYAFKAKIGGKWNEEVPDPQAKAVGVNGNRGMIVNFSNTNPEGWETDQRPSLEHPTDIIIYELHFRDLSMHPNSGIKHKGKYLGLTEAGTTTPEGELTGLDHIKSLGVTHIHILPSYDHYSIDETKLDQPQFNWGYDPQNYNVPEGSYATDPYDGRVRIKEFKQMVKTLHDNGLRVVLDVVYNHTGKTEETSFNQLVPGYYYRQNAEGGFSNASACGNETASERAMMRAFIIKSVLHWVNEYHIDGFRFDLMGIHDIETMNQISEAVHAIDSTIFLYGEGWTAGDSPIPSEQQALKRNTTQLKNIAAFSDDMRDAVKGHVFTHDAKGFASGQQGIENSVKFGIVASTQHPQIDYANVNYSDAPWAPQPSQCINYVSCHDNHTLWDRINNSNPEDTETDKIRMHQLANAIVLTSQGVPFLHAGVELLRTKNGEENSFESPDAINQIDWQRKSKYPKVFSYYQDLIRLRKAHAAFRMRTTEMIQQHLQFIDTEAGVIAYTITNHANEDTAESLLVIFNANKSDKTLDLPQGKWTVILDDTQYKESGVQMVESTVSIPKIGAMVLKQ